eukprot:Platyproteum_vivax@DN10102_c0_g1_i1.p1
MSDVNDMRITVEGLLVAICTSGRFPCGVEVVDLETETHRRLLPSHTSGMSKLLAHFAEEWIHAIDLTEEKTTRNIIAVGENSGDGSFHILQLDTRLVFVFFY